MERERIKSFKISSTQNLAIWATAYHLHITATINAVSFSRPSIFSLYRRWEEKISVSNRGKLANTEKTIEYNNMFLHLSLIVFFDIFYGVSRIYFVNN